MSTPLLRYTAFLSIFATILDGGKAELQNSNNLRRRIGDATCPCIDSDFDSKLINAVGNMQIDLHRQRSCLPKNSQAQRIYWTPLDPDERPNTPIIRPIDGVKYNYLMTLLDEENEEYYCVRNDMKFHNLSLQEAEACMARLDDVCDNVFPKLCAFDVTNMEAVKDSASNGELMLDQTNSCKEPSDTEEYLGIYTNGGDTVAAISFASDKYIYDSGDPKEIEFPSMQGLHCKNLIDTTCSAWDLTGEIEPLCMDDPDFVLHATLMEEVEDLIFGNANGPKDCEWVASNKKACATKCRTTGKRVFQACCDTCGYCNCSDSETYRFNGQPGKGCDWIQEDPVTRCTLDGAKENCKTACDAKCCKDNPKFRFEKNEIKNCAWARKNWKRKPFRCAKKAVAANCPESCDLCPSQ